jgi:hypothetical protein
VVGAVAGLGGTEIMGAFAGVLVAGVLVAGVLLTGAFAGV